jgi:hypothetical protein
MIESLTQTDIDALRSAVKWLEVPSFAAHLTSMLGRPIDLIGKALPPGASQAIAKAAAKSLQIATKIALSTIRNRGQESSLMLHRALAVASGAAGGAFGLSSLPFEVPVSTIIMLRSILDIARSEGENLADPEAALACIEVFGLGGRTESDKTADAGYFAIRGMLATSVTEAARFITERGLADEGAPVLVRLIAQISARFGGVVTQKAAAQAIPIIGALGGAAVNYAFIEHFQAIARGHFIVRRLERVYGKDVVRAAYEQFSRETKPTTQNLATDH